MQTVGSYDPALNPDQNHIVQMRLPCRISGGSSRRYGQKKCRNTFADISTWKSASFGTQLHRWTNRGRCFQMVVFKWTFWRSVAGDLHLGSYRVVCGLWRLAFGIGQFVFKSWFFGALTECAILLQHTRIDTLSIGLGGPWGRHYLARWLFFRKEACFFK